LNLCSILIDCNHEDKKTRLANKASVYTAELSAISQALSLIEKETEDRKVIFSDSLSSLQAMEYMYPKSNPILTEIQDELAEIGETKTVKFVWTPGHAGIDSNEKADEGAKEALRQCLPPQSTVVAADLITRTKFNAKKIIEQAWQQSDSPMTRFKNTIERWKPNVNLNRHQQVVLFRLRMCHTHFTHSHHMTRERSPMCDQCNTTTTVALFLLECTKFQSERIKHKIDESCLENDYKKTSGF
jgi:ribonuclease HI